MEWKEVSPGIHTAQYEGYTITRLLEQDPNRLIDRDPYQKQYFEFVAVKGDDKINRDNLEDLKAMIHKRSQQSLFKF